MTDWQRLEQVVKWSGMSTNKFALHIGLKRSENLYQIKRGNFGISKELARLIVEHYPQISQLWLLTGHGDMLHGEDSADAQMMSISKIKGAIPYYSMHADTLIGLDYSEIEPQSYMLLPSLEDCDLAAPITGNAMSPQIESGAVLALKKISIENLLPGQIYLVSTKEFAALRFLRADPQSKNKVILIPQNTDSYDQISIDKSKINSLYLVRGVLNFTGA